MMWDGFIEYVLFPLTVAAVSGLFYKVFSYYSKKEKKLRISEEILKSEEIRRDITKIVDERNMEQKKQIETFVAALGNFNQALTKLEKSSNDILNLSKRMNEDVNEFKKRFEKIEKRMETDYQLLYKILEKMSKQLIKMQTVHNFCHPDHQIQDHDN